MLILIGVIIIVVIIIIMMMTAQEREWQICEVETRFGLGHSRQGARDPTLQVGVDVDDGGGDGVAIKSF